MENIEKVSVEAKFYQDVADLLNVDNHYEVNINKGWRTRWNNRKPGNGRFEGYGLVRFYGPGMIHVILHCPVSINKVFNSPEEVLVAIKTAIDNIDTSA